MNKFFIVGDYVRTKQGYIAKLEKITKDFLHFDNTIYNRYEASSILPIDEELLDGTHLRAVDFIIKRSPNLIDLIEVRRLCECTACKKY